MENPMIFLYLAIGLVLFLVLSKSLFGIVIVRETEVGIVIKKYGTRELPAGQLIALNGEAGYQADTLAPGWHLWYWPWQYQVVRAPMVSIPQGEIGLVVANAGTPIPAGHMLGKFVDSNNFQDARSFLEQGGEKGRQLSILTAGTYRINTALFTVITRENAEKHGMTPDSLLVYYMEPDRVGIVTTLDGAPIEQGEIAGPYVAGHDNFQNAQSFLNSGGRRGLQEQVLLSGSWNLNPWFVEVERVSMTEVPIGHVGVVVSYVGAAHKDVSGTEFLHGDLVDVGHKGVWITPLYPGKHPINTRVMKTELVPTTNIVLNWANRTEAHKYDSNLNSITVRSKDGFSFNLDVAQVIHVAAPDAPKVISRVGSMQNLVDHVLEPIVGNYFRNSAQHYTVLDFLTNRSDRQKEAAEFIRKGVATYDVQAVDTLIGDIDPPAQLMATQTDRKIAEEQEKTYQVQRAAQMQRQLLVRETATADIQSEVVRSEQGVNIAELQASAQVKRVHGEAESTKLQAGAEAEATKMRAAAESQSIQLRGTGEAEAIRAVGNAKAEAYRAGVESLGVQSFSALQLMQMIGDKNVRIVSDVLVNGSNGSAGLGEALLGMLLRRETTGQASASSSAAESSGGALPS
jgi:uncharacterized membrane protein YqiK